MLNLFVIKRRIEVVKVLWTEMILHNPKRLAEALEVHNLPLAKEFDRIPHVWIIRILW